MELLRFIPVKLTILLIAGILLGKYIDLQPVYPLALALLSFLPMGILFYRRYFTLAYSIAASITTICLGMLSYALSQPGNHANHYTRFDFQGQKQFHIKVRDVLKGSTYNTRYTTELFAMDSAAVGGKLLLSIPSEMLGITLEVDDELMVRATLEPMPQPLNPHQFNYGKHLEGLGIFHQLRLNRQDFCYIDNPEPTIIGYTANLRNTIVSRLESKGFGKEELAIVKALILGQRNDIPADTYDAYKNAGAVHILAVSGLHIGILLWLLHFILRPVERLPKGKTIKLLLLLALLWSYAILAGLSASIIRAVSMFSFVAYALYLNRPANSFNILALSMFFVLLAFNSGLLFSPGFQMSYAAVFAIVWIYPKFQACWRPRQWFLKKVWQLLSVSIAAQLGVLPISLYYFHQFPGLFFISNLLVVPFLGLLLGMGFLLALLAILQLLPPVLPLAYEGMIAAMNALIGWVARQETFLFRDIPFDLVMLLFTYLIICCLALMLSKVTFKRVVILLAGIIAMQLRNTHRAIQLRGKEVVWILHQPRNTQVFHQTGRLLRIASRSGSTPAVLLSGFRVGEGIRSINEVPLYPAYHWQRSALYLIDEKGTLPESSEENTYLLLTNSPKVHLERLLEKATPKAVIADGSNYTSYVARWEVSCREKNIPFHSTASDGAYRLEIDQVLAHSVH